MKKMMKKNSNKGFSLVELIIVISIMAILMGVVGTQVLPYLNRSKETNDNACLSKIHSAAVSAFAFHADELTATANYTITCTAAGDSVSKTVAGSGSTEFAALTSEIYTLMGIDTSNTSEDTIYEYFHNNATSDDGEQTSTITVVYNGTTGVMTVQAYNGAVGTANEVLKTIESK